MLIKTVAHNHTLFSQGMERGDGICHPSSESAGGPNDEKLNILLNADILKFNFSQFRNTCH